MEQLDEERVIGIVSSWLSQQKEATIIFSSSQLLNYWENRLLSVLGSLGGVRLSLFAGIVEAVTRFRSEERRVDFSDQIYLIWGSAKQLEKQGEDSSAEWARTGLSKTLALIIRELKQAGIRWGSELNQVDSLPGPLRRIFGAYQANLKLLAFKDAEDSLAEACDRLQSREIPEFLKRVLVVGFQDFTAQQEKFLSILKPKTEFFVSPSGRFSAFSRSGGEDIANLVSERRKEGLAFSGLTAANREWEVRGIAREIRKLLAEGVPPDEIAVVFRDLQTYRPYLNRIFDEYRIPWSGRHTLPWINLPCLSSLLLGLKIARTGDVGWTEMTHFLNQYFTGNDGLIVDQWLMKAAPLSPGAQSLEDWSRWLEERAQTAGPHLAAKTRFLVQWLRKSACEMPLGSFWRSGQEWLENWTDFPLRFSAGRDPWSRRHALLWKARSELLAVWRRWTDLTLRLGWQEMTLTNEDFVQLLEQLLADCETAENSLHAPEVIVAAPSEIKGSPFTVLFLGGLVEGEFPRTPTSSGLIPAEAFSRLKKMGYALRSAEEFILGERLTFIQLLRSAGERLYLSRPTADPDGRLLLPSPFLAELESVLGEEASSWPHLTPARRFNLEPLNPNESALQFWRNDDGSNGAPPAPEIIGCIRAETGRRRGDPRYVGRIGADPDIARELATDFSPAYVFSPSALKSYAVCPFAFFCRRVLRVKPYEKPAPLPDPSELGDLYHEILKNFLARHAGERLSAAQKERYLREIEEIADQSAKNRFISGDQSQNASVLWNLQLAAVKETLRHFVADEIRWQERIGWRYLPHLFELEFGGSAGRPALNVSDGRNLVRVGGKIDRLDRRVDGKAFIVFDYKSGKVPSSREIDDGLDLQLPIYLLAAREALAPAEELGAGYCSLKSRERTAGLWRKAWCAETGVTIRHAKDDPDWSNCLESAKAYILHYGTAIRSGDFRPTAGDCADYCEYKEACRRRLTGGLKDEAE